MANMVQQLVEEREKALSLISGLTDAAADDSRDLSEQDMVVIKSKQERIGQIDGQLQLLLSLQHLLLLSVNIYSVHFRHLPERNGP